MRNRLLLFWDTVRSSYGFIPSLMLLGGGLLAFAAVALDQKVDDGALSGFWWIFSGGAEGARSLLSTVAGAIITVAATTFSITMAVLSLTSSQFGPRLLRGFLRDAGNQVVLGTFLGTFLYCLLVMRTVRSVEEVYFVPHIAVTGGVALAVASVGVLVFFIQHVSKSIQATEIIASVARDLDRTIDRLFPEDAKPGEKEDAIIVPEDWEETACDIDATKNGYIQALDADDLVDLATRRNLTIKLYHKPGDFVTEGSRLALVWPAHHLEEERVSEKIHDAFTLGQRRTNTQDVGFVIQQLVEVAVRALSPGINDPFTALSCLDRLGASLCRLAGRPVPSPVRYGKRGAVRLIGYPATFDEFVVTAFSSIRHYGKTDPQVMIRVIEVIEDITACTTTPEQREVLRHQADLTLKAARRELKDEEDITHVEAHYRATMREIDEKEAEAKSKQEDKNNATAKTAVS